MASEPAIAQLPSVQATRVVDPTINATGVGELLPQNSTALIDPDRDPVLNPKFHREIDTFGPIETVFTVAGGAFVDFLDVTASSTLPGVDREDLNQFILQAAPERTQQLFGEQKGAIEAVSGIGSIFSGATLGLKIVQGGSALAKLATVVPGARKLFVNEKAIRLAQRAVLKETKLAASKGKRGSAVLQDPALKAATNKLRRVQAGQAAKSGLAQEIAIFGIANESDFVFPEELEDSTLLAFAALGVAIPAAGQIFRTNHQLRKLAVKNSPLAHAQYDRGHLFGYAADGQTPLSRKEMERIVLTDDAISDVRMTEHFSTAAAADSAVRSGSLDSELTSLLNTQAAAHLDAGQNVFQTIWRRGQTGLPVNPGNVPPGVLNHVQRAAKDNPTFGTGVTYITDAPKTDKQLTELLETRTKRVATLREDADKLMGQVESASVTGGTTAGAGGKITFAGKQITESQALEFVGKFRREATDMENWIPGVMRDTEFVPVEDVFGYFNRYGDDAARAPIVTEKDGERLIKQIIEGFDPGTQKKLPQLSVSNELEVSLPRSRKGQGFNAAWVNLSKYAKTALYALGDAQITSLLKSGKAVTIGEKSTFFQLDMAEELLRRSNGNHPVTFRNGMSREDAMLQSFKQKAIMFNRMMDGGITNKTEIRELLNFPRTQAFERATDLDDSAIELFLSSKRIAGDKQLNELTFQGLENELKAARAVPDIAESFTAKPDLLGTSFKIGVDNNNNPLGQFFSFRRNLTQPDYSREVFGLQEAARYTNIINTLSNEGKSSLVSRLVADVFGTPDFINAQRVSLLSDSTITSSIPFLSNTRSTAQVTFANNAFRDNPTLMGAFRVTQVQDKSTRKFTDIIYSGTDAAGQPVAALRSGKNRSFNQVAGELRSAANRGSMQLFGQTVSARRHGFDVKAGTAGTRQLSDGNFGFVLDNTEFNKKRWRDLFQEDLPEDSLLSLPHRVNGEIRPAVVDSLALEAFEVIDSIGRALLKEQNVILDAKGLGQIAPKPFHIPPRNFQGKFVRFVLDPTTDGGKVLHTIEASTERELAQKSAHSAIQELVEQRKAILVSPDDVAARWPAISDRLWYELAPADLPIVQVGKRSKGTSGAPFLEEGSLSLEEMVTSVNRQINNLARDTRKLLFDPQIQYTNTMEASLHSGSPVNRKFFGGNRSIGRIYRDVLLGDRALTADTPVGQFFLPIENFFNQGLRLLHDKTQGRGVIGAISRNFAADEKGLTRGDRQLFENLKSELSEHLPFNDAVEFAASRFDARPPATLQQSMAALNQITSGLTLRWFEIAHPILNVSGVVNTMPAVMNFFRVRPNEVANPTKYAERAGLWGHVIDTSKGPVGTLDMTKVMMRSLHDALNTNAGRADLDFIKRMGYADQAVAEIHKTLGNPGRTVDWYHDLIRKTDTIVGGLSDKSEEFSRLWSHLAGLRVAREFLGITEQRAQHIYAHNFANQVIGDYASHNRPQIFQGGVGLPLGLFQTYMFNYFSRIFRYVEQGDARSLTIQAAMQASVFGGRSLPGFDMSNRAFLAAQGDGKLDPVNSIYNRFGRHVGDGLMHGTISNLPKLLGASDGLSLFTRGDVSPRIPTSVLDTASGNLFVAAFRGIGRGVDLFREGHPGITDQELMEIVATFSTNRPLRGILEIAADNAVDRRGNVIATDTQSAMSVAARLIGLRPSSEQSQTDAYFRNRFVQSMDLAKRERLRFGTKSAIRGGELNPERLLDSFEQYVHSGGNPAYFRTWLRDTLISAVTPRAQKQFLETLKKSSRFDQLQRLLNAGVLDNAEEPSVLPNQTGPGTQ